MREIRARRALHDDLEMLAVSSKREQGLLGA